MHDDSLQLDTIPHIASQSRSDTSYSNSTVDDKAVVNAALSNETPVNSWNIALGNEILKVELPILEESMPRSDACHHDSGASRHVFHDRSAFETYRAIDPVAVKGFGRGLTAAAVGYGTVRVIGRYGDRASPIILNNVLHIPAARSNLVSGLQLDRAGVSSLLENGLACLASRGVKIVGGAVHEEMYRLNMTIVRPKGPQAPSLLSRLGPPTLLSRIAPLAAAVSLDQAGFCIA
jgi:hypothetical protein